LSSADVKAAFFAAGREVGEQFGIELILLPRGLIRKRNDGGDLAGGEGDTHGARDGVGGRRDIHGIGRRLVGSGGVGGRAGVSAALQVAREFVERERFADRDGDRRGQDVGGLREGAVGQPAVGHVSQVQVLINSEQREAKDGTENDPDDSDAAQFPAWRRGNRGLLRSIFGFRGTE
jgi:hypothetical protein